MSEPLPCPSCGKERLVRVMEDCTLDDGVIVRRLRHLKCESCQSRYFDDDAMHQIQIAREKNTSATRT